MMSRAAVYRIFTRPQGDAASVRSVVVAFVLIACMAVGLAVLRVSRQHEVLALGYRLAHDSEQIRQLREVRRRLELERAALSTPDRIRRLATELGMTTVAPDKIRVISATPPPRVKVAISQ